MRMPNKKKLSIVIPVHNEEKILKKSLSYLISNLKKINLSYELIIVENGSTDKSKEIINGFAKKNKNIRYISLSFPSYGNAILLGYKLANNEIVCNFSVDWIDIEFLKKALKLIPKFDLVVATKNAFQSQDKRPSIRHIGGKIYHIMVRLLFGLPISDTHGIKVFKRLKILPIVKICGNESETFDTELVVRVYKNGLAITEVPVLIREMRPTRVKVLSRGIKGFLQLINLKFKISALL